MALRLCVCIRGNCADYDAARAVYRKLRALCEGRDDVGVSETGCLGICTGGPLIAVDSGGPVYGVGNADEAEAVFNCLVRREIPRNFLVAEPADIPVY